ncbi:MAG: hypothetical protein INH41_04855 [Myxococcaceae bacterium]|nr:hypothetical protein [Myxococcaceae bacterium]
MKAPVLPVIVVLVFIAGFVAGRLSVPAPAGGAPSAPAPTTAAEPPPAPANGGLTGVVAEVLQVPNYTYLRLTTSSGEAWAAVPSTTGVGVGQAVEVTSSTTMTDFTSKTLGRTFPAIVFGQLAGTSAAPAAPGAPGLPANHPPLGTSTGTNPVAKALDATLKAEPPLTLRIADVFAERQALAGRLVRVTATVAKVTTVNGLSYAHLGDGSGAPVTKDDDLVAVGEAPLTAGQRVTVQGAVVLDKDVGIGAVWPVALERVQLVPAR